MARVTVEDCIEEIPNRFELVMLTSQRARKIGTGSPLTIDRDNDKNTVVALREIAEKTVAQEDMKEELTRSHQRILFAEEDEKEPTIDLMDGEAEWSKMTSKSIEEKAESGEINLSDLAGL